MAVETSLEFVDGDGKKVRVNVSGHWPLLVNRFALALENLAKFSGDLKLSDYEESAADDKCRACEFAGEAAFQGATHDLDRPPHAGESPEALPQPV